MASPQVENGHTDIAHEILEQLAKAHLSGSEWSILAVVFRRTYGWHKTEEFISLTQFQAATGYTRWTVWDAIERLLGKNILFRNNDIHTQKGVVRKNVLPSTENLTTYPSKYRFNKDFETWILSEKGSTENRTSTETRTRGSTENPTNLVRKPVLPTASKPASGKPKRGAKEKIKEIIKETNNQDSISKETICKDAASAATDGKNAPPISNQPLIAELVGKYRSQPNIPQGNQGDYPFIGRLYNQFGYDEVLLAIESLGDKTIIEPIREPLKYLFGILKNGNKYATLQSNGHTRISNKGGLKNWADKQGVTMEDV